jgi:hypothetical protein
MCRCWRRLKDTEWGMNKRTRDERACAKYGHSPRLFLTDLLCAMYLISISRRGSFDLATTNVIMILLGIYHGHSLTVCCNTVVLRSL